MNSVFMSTRLGTIYILHKDNEVGKGFKKAPKHPHVAHKCSIILRANNALKAFLNVIIFENIPRADRAP